MSYRPFRWILVLVAVVTLVVGGGCGNPSVNIPATATPRVNNAVTATVQPTAPVTVQPTASAVVPGKAIKTVFLILMENHDWSQIKNSPSAPYINGTLLPMASYAQQYYNPPGNHPSEPNYLWLEAGTNFDIFDDKDPATHDQSTKLHLVTLLNNAHIAWKSYQEDISGNDCPLADTDEHGYAVRHNPMVFFDDVTNTNDPHSAYCIAHVRPYSELGTDLQKNTVARYNFITPNLCDDMHTECKPLKDKVKQGDNWLAQNLPTILNSEAYKNGGVIFITWDEGKESKSDGPIGMIVLSPDAKGGGYANTIHYTHSSTLRTLEEIFGVSPLLGDAAHATDLSDLFKTFP